MTIFDFVYNMYVYIYIYVYICNIYIYIHALTKLSCATFVCNDLRKGLMVKNPAQAAQLCRLRRVIGIKIQALLGREVPASRKRAK